MKVHPDIVKTGVLTVAEVRTCLKSEEMYLNPAMYNLMCCGWKVASLKMAKSSKLVLPCVAWLLLRTKRIFAWSSTSHSRGNGIIRNQTLPMQREG